MSIIRENKIIWYFEIIRTTNCVYICMWVLYHIHLTHFFECLNNGICFFMEMSTFCFHENCITFGAPYLTYMDHIHIYLWYIFEPLYLILVINMICGDYHIYKVHEPTSVSVTVQFKSKSINEVILFFNV